MELTESWFLSEMSNLLVCVLALLAISCIGYFLVNRRDGKRSADGIGSFAISVMSFAILGFVTGKIMSDSREPSVSAVLPAALTLMGGVVAYLVGTQGPTIQILVSGLLLNFGLSLFIGADYGSAIREEVDDAHEMVVERSQLGVDSMRLGQYVKILQLERDFEEKYKPKYTLDLSKFASSYEKGSQDDEELLRSARDFLEKFKSETKADLPKMERASEEKK